MLEFECYPELCPSPVHDPCLPSKLPQVDTHPAARPDTTQNRNPISEQAPIHPNCPVKCSAPTVCMFSPITSTPRPTPTAQPPPKLPFHLPSHFPKPTKVNIGRSLPVNCYSACSVRTRCTEPTHHTTPPTHHLYHPQPAPSGTIPFCVTVLFSPLDYYTYS